MIIQERMFDEKGSWKLKEGILLQVERIN